MFYLSNSSDKWIEFVKCVVGQHQVDKRIGVTIQSEIMIVMRKNQVIRNAIQNERSLGTFRTAKRVF